MRAGSWVPAFVVVACVSACGGQSLSRDADGRDDTGDDDGASNGGNSGVGTGGSSTGGGAGGFAGSAGTSSCAQPLESLGVGCDFGSALRQSCARGGCHNAVFASAGLDLTADDMLIARILDAPARFGNISLPGTTTVCMPATCPPFGSTLLVDSSAPEQSWMLRKMEPFVPGSTDITDIGCGTDMPYPPGNSGYTDASKACLTELFFAIAATGRPCPTGPIFRTPPPPCPVYE